MATTLPLTSVETSACLSVHAVEDVDAAEWDARVAAAGGTIFHSSAAGRVLAAEGFTPWYLEIVRGNSRVGVAIAGSTRSRLPLVGARRSQFYLQTTPLLDADVDLLDAVRAIGEFASAHGFGWLQCSAFDSLNPEATQELAALGLEVTPRLEFRVPLMATLDETIETMSRKHRQNVRRAMQQGLEFREDSSMDGALALRPLQENTYARRWADGRTDVQIMDREFYEHRVQGWLAAGALRIWFVEHNGEPLSALGVLTFGTRGYCLVAGTSKPGYTVRAAYAVYGHVIEELCRTGVTELNLSGVPATAACPDDPDFGLFRFKRGFGGTVSTCWDAHGRV
jgi:Acetyltransferase (GNAT) domain